MREGSSEVLKGTGNCPLPCYASKSADESEGKWQQWQQHWVLWRRGFHTLSPLRRELTVCGRQIREKLIARQWHPTPVLLPGKPHGRRSLVGYSPWGREESDVTEQLHSHFSLSLIGEGNGSPLQCSCLENPRDGGAWWAAVYGVAQSRTEAT